MTAAPTAKPTTMLDWALHYAAAGFEVFPVAADKSPLVDNGFYEGTRDLATITGWWRRWPSALIGCRVPENVVILDVDPRHGGDATWRELEQAYGAVPAGREHRSGRGDGGCQRWFVRPAGQLTIKPLNDWARRNNVGSPAGKASWTAGIDILHRNQRYTILPPSLHPASGKPYTWASKAEPVEMPGWLVDLITKPATPAAPRQTGPRIADTDSIADWFSQHATWNDILGPAGWELVQGDGDGDGSKWRHPNATAASSCSIKHGCLFVYTPNTDFEQTEEGDRHGYTRFRAWAIIEHDGDMQAAARAARAQRDGSTGTAVVLARPIHKPTQDARADTDEWPDPIPLSDTSDLPSFPIEALPAWMGAYAYAVAEEIQVSPDLPAVLGVAALAIANAAHHRVQIVPGGWSEPLNIYAVVALPPSAGKSPVMKRMLGPIHAHELEERARMQDRIEHVAQKRRIAEKAMKRAEDKGDIAEAQRALDTLLNTPMPVAPRWIADDATPEALAQLLHDQGGVLALVSTEGGPFDIMAGRYSERANLDIYLKAWGGDQVVVDRIGRPSITISEPRLTMAITVQPQVVTSLADKPEFHGRGLLARVMFSLPEDIVGWRDMSSTIVADPVVRDEYERRLLGMLRRDVPAEPAPVTIDDAARTMFLSWRQGLEDRRRQDGDLRPLAEWTTKLESTVARVAALLAVADGRLAVDAGTMGRALSIGNYWLAHAQAVHDLWSVDPRVEAARQILSWAGQKELAEFSVRELYGALRRRFPTVEDTREPLLLLTERGWLRPLFDGPLVVGRRGHDSPRFSVHPSNLWITQSHARHARVFPKNQKSVFSLSLFSHTNTDTRAHDAHDAHEPLGPVDIESPF